MKTKLKFDFQIDDKMLVRLIVALAVLLADLWFHK
jgi:hypothetical protein